MTATTSPAAVQLDLDTLGTPLIDVTFVVLDLETTGLDPATDRITELGAVKVRGGEVLGELRTFVHPGRPIPAAITRLTGITDHDVAHAPRIEAVLDHVLTFLSDAVFVAHNARFDLGFLGAALERSHRRQLRPVVIDTARLSRRLLGHEVRNHRLATVASHLRARLEPDHRALTDARATVDVLHALIERAAGLGAVTLDDLVELTRSRSERTYRRRSLVADAPSAPGVYRFLDAGGTALYIGKATDLRQRVRTYFGQDQRRRTADLVRETASVTYEVTPTVIEAEIRELRAIRDEQPRFNQRDRTRRPERFLAVTREPFPRLAVVRAPGPGHLTAFGPFASARVAEQLREAVQQVVPIRACNQRLRQRQDHRPCMLKDLGRCGAPCDGSLDATRYAEVVDQAVASLDDGAPLVTALRARMQARAAAGRFEEAALTRHQLHATARSLLALRRNRWLSDPCAMLLARPAPAGDTGPPQAVLLRHGRLVTSARTDGQDAASRLDALADAVSSCGTTCAPTAELPELQLLHHWFEAGGVRIVASTDPLAEPVAGGAMLTATVAEARQLDRQRRRDEQLITGAKVRRRTTAASGDGRTVGKGRVGDQQVDRAVGA